VSPIAKGNFSTLPRKNHKSVTIPSFLIINRGWTYAFRFSSEKSCWW